jgi:succinyl-diaminopimelate desuccinylase
MTATLDPVELARALIRRPSVTPADAGAMDVLQEALTGIGFACRRMRFGAIENLYARWGEQGPNLCFAGHTDVVPVGDAAAWSKGAFDASVESGVLIGRGAVDMKGAIACMAAACERAIAAGRVRGSLSFLITGDEEGVAIDGTGPVVEALIAEGERIDHCVLGEPTSAAKVADTLKIGRRGSLNVTFIVEGRQGHVAYPQQSLNPIPVLIRLLDRIESHVLDEGYPQFPASNLEITTVDVGNPATNVIPARASARINIRFNPAHTGETLIQWLRDEAAIAQEGFAGRVTLEPALTGEAFLTEPGSFVDLLAGAVAEETGARPELSTTGGISDARFIRALCPVVELGLVNATMHAVDEQVPLAHLEQLTKVYARVIERYFENPPT